MQGIVSLVIAMLGVVVAFGSVLCLASGLLELVLSFTPKARARRAGIRESMKWLDETNLETVPVVNVLWLDSYLRRN
jgi:hypothetical protein